MAEPLRIMIAAGGTGGHVFPAIAIAEAIRAIASDSRILFIGTRNRMEWQAVPAAGFDIAPLWISGIHRRLTLKNLLFPLKLAFSLWQSSRLLSQFRPDAVLCCGGFVSGPLGWMAARRSFPLYLQEQNSYPGLTNRKLAGRATRIFAAFEESLRWFPAEKTMVTGNPVRLSMIPKSRYSGNDEDNKEKQRLEAKARFGFEKGRLVLAVLGGSGGAQSINHAMASHLEELHDALGLQIIWQCGPRYLEEIAIGLKGDRGDISEYSDRYPRLRLFGFVDDMVSVWQAADMVISRAGATTCSEILVTGKAAVLVPSPWVAADHQTKNAMALVKKNAAVLLKDELLNSGLVPVVRELTEDSPKRRLLETRARQLSRTDSAAVIASTIIKEASGRVL